MKRIFLFLLLASFAAFAQQPGASPSPFPEPDRQQAARNSIAGYLRLAQNAVQNNNLSVAEAFFERMLNVPAPDIDKRAGLLAMARAYEEAKVYAKAIAVYEKFNHLFPRDAEAPDILLKLGRLYREAGAHQLALDRFYNVLNSVLKINGNELPVYKAATLTAQFEIAETYFDVGDYKQANKFFNLISLLDLTPEDRDRATFRALYCLFLLNQYTETIAAAKGFLEQYPDSPNLPETRYIIAMSLKAANRPQEALTYTLDLLRGEKAKAGKDPAAWITWKCKTGNQIANDFYQQGDFLKALTIYQSLATLNEAPDWQWPVIYQMGICFERLRLSTRALEAYQFIVEDHKKVKDPASLPSTAAAFSDMARWRMDSLKWQQKTEAQLTSLLGPPELADDLIPSLPVKGGQTAATGKSASAGETPQAPAPVATPAPTPVPSPAAAPSATPVPSPTAAPSPTPVPSPAATPSPTPVPSPAATPSPTPVPSPTATPSVTPVPTAAPGVSPGPSAAATPRRKATPKPTAPQPSATPTPQPTPKKPWLLRLF
ncbi:MAG: tetratricopeptide repeat protein [Chthoniobacteraceae bacterium]|nr:tetratricopeptide repeat protein [Chthoniobacteraceae bacterium]